MDAKAIKLIDMVLTDEGGYASPKFDGHETYRGITRDNHPNWAGWKIVDANKPLKHGQIIKNTSLENDVRQFYYENYYTPMKIQSLNDLLTSGQLFAMGVNAGSKNAIKLLQKAINKIYNVQIAVDGIIGKNTLSYANGSKSVEVGQEMINQCNGYYDAIVRRNPANKKFLKGWKNRVKHVTQVCNTPFNSKTVLATTYDYSNKWYVKLLKWIIEKLK